MEADSWIYSLLKRVQWRHSVQIQITYHTPLEHEKVISPVLSLFLAAVFFVRKESRLHDSAVSFV